jgi:hypothetical protein
VLVTSSPPRQPPGDLRRLGDLCHKPLRGMILTPSGVRYTE